MFLYEEGLKKIFFNEEGCWLEIRICLMVLVFFEGVKVFVEQFYVIILIIYIGKVEQFLQILYRVEIELVDVVFIKLLNESG